MLIYLKYLIIAFSTTFYYALKSQNVKCNLEKSHKWHVIGIYSACYNQANRTELNHLAEDLDNAMDYMWKQRAHTRFGYSKSYKKGFINVTYISVDICNDFSRLPRSIESIYLNETYYYQSWSKRLNKTYNLPNIIAIYAEGPPEMMDYLEASFHGDIRFAGRYASFNTSIDIEHVRIYTTILYYIITHRLKWERLLILNVRPSPPVMSPLYNFLRRKAIESKLCVHIKEVDRSLNISHENYFNDTWFKENKPAVITIGDKYGQVEIINQLGKIMKKENITIPILAEGFKNVIYAVIKGPENFDCFKDFTSSLVTSGSARTWTGSSRRPATASRRCSPPPPSTRTWRR